MLQQFKTIRDYVLHEASGYSKHLGDERLEPGSDLSGGQVSGSCYEFDPQGHGSLSSVAEFEDGATGQSSVVDKIENAHLIEIEDDFELARRNDFESLEAAIALCQRGDESRLLHFHFFQNILNHFAHFAQRFGDLAFARLNPFAVILVQLVEHLGLGRHHIRRDQHFRET